MRNLGLAIIAVLMSITVGFAQNSDVKSSKKGFNVSYEKLSDYLKLTPNQLEEVDKINDYFAEMQKRSIDSKGNINAKKMHEAVYGNLKLMKETLTEDQYRKYIALINITNFNSQIMTVELPDIHLAEKE